MVELSHYQRIIVGVDGSKQARLALEKAIAVAQRNQAALFIVSVLDLGKLIGVGQAQFGFGALDQEVLDEVKSKMERRVASYHDLAIKAGVPRVEMHVTFGNPKLELAKNLPSLFKADLIILGATGSNAVSRMLMGSNASYVVANAQIDVIIVRTDSTNETG
ncbi:universal stress protein [Secundilactobacillus folii]|uniref:Universal stress protein n=1 Tax=Secundilactobacillus folii TaxID=2678357 RepID=A0A7X3C3Z6_9LACO|nr:universal stress protein [Secundilactobacillus folii]MTV83042.1 universal stress protein [Secundilactobacillus folii]